MDEDPDKLRTVASEAMKLAMEHAIKTGRGQTFHEIMLHLWLEMTHLLVTNGTSFALLTEFHQIEMGAEARRNAAH